LGHSKGHKKLGKRNVTIFNLARPAANNLLIDHKFMMILPAEHFLDDGELYLFIKFQVKRHIGDPVIEKEVFEELFRNIIRKHLKKITAFISQEINQSKGFTGSLHCNINADMIFRTTNKLNPDIRLG
jgi:hypothetical protein